MLPVNLVGKRKIKYLVQLGVWGKMLITKIIYWQIWIRLILFYLYWIVWLFHIAVEKLKIKYWQISSLNGLTVAGRKLGLEFILSHIKQFKKDKVNVSQSLHTYHSSIWWSKCGRLARRNQIWNPNCPRQYEMQNKTCANLKSLFKAGQSQTHQGLPDSRPNGWWSHIGIAKMVRLGYLCSAE